MDKYLEELTQFGIDRDKGEIAEHFRISPETVSRYLRAIKQQGRGIVDGRLPKILIIDIETSPIKAFTWGLWKQNINPHQIIQDWFIIGWAAKWLFEDRIYSEYITSEEAQKGEDKSVMQGVWDLLDQADIVVAHNAKKFDIPRINTRLLLNGMTPPAPYQVIDTLYYYRKQFAISSNKLDYINFKLALPTKVDTGGFQLWVDCLDGKQEALDKMEKYNINDVLILEDNYLTVRPWIINHPNIGVYMDNDELTCTNCGSTNLIKATTDYATPVNLYALYRCSDCGAIAGRLRKSILSKDSTGHILRAQAR